MFTLVFLGPQARCFHYYRSPTRPEAGAISVFVSVGGKHWKEYNVIHLILLGFLFLAVSRLCHQGAEKSSAM